MLDYSRGCSALVPYGLYLPRWFANHVGAEIPGHACSGSRLHPYGTRVLERKPGHTCTVLLNIGGVPAIHGDPVIAPRGYAAGRLSVLSTNALAIFRFLMARTGPGAGGRSGHIAAEVLLVVRAKSAEGRAPLGSYPRTSAFFGSWPNRRRGDPLWSFRDPA